MYDMTPQTDHGLAYPTLRPAPHLLTLLIRSAILDDGRGGPWLSVVRSHTTAGTPVYVHHIHTHPVDLHSTRRLVLLSGDEALSYALNQKWTNLADPSVGQLRRLGTYAVELHDGAAWDRHYVSWHQRYAAAAEQREEHWALCASDARALRRREAERCLGRPAQG